jgi:hypothetical protein
MGTRSYYVAFFNEIGFCYAGDASPRRMIRQYEYNPLREAKSKGTGVMLTTTELAMMDMAHLEPIRWAMIAVDKPHRLKIEDESCIGVW